MKSEPAKLPEAVSRRASILDTFKAVASSFFGVRGRRAHEQDVKSLNPVHVVLVGLLMAGLFVATLLMVVRAVLS